MPEATKRYPNPPMSLVIGHFLEEHRDVMDRAAKEFFEYVQVDEERISDEKSMQLFYEWFVYDFQLKTGKTALETYIFRNPDKLSEQKLDWMKQAGDSNFTSHFWIGKVVKQHHQITLEECSTGQQYKIRDIAASRTAQSNIGWMAARLFEINGRWYLASDPIIYAPLKPTAAMKRHMAEVKAYEEGDSASKESFIDIVRKNYSINQDEFDEIEVLASGAANSLHGEDLATRRNTIASRFFELKSQYNLEADFEDVLIEIYASSQEYPPSFAFSELFGDAITDEDAAKGLLGFFVDAWNHFPHISLGAFSPCEMYDDED